MFVFLQERAEGGTAPGSQSPKAGGVQPPSSWRSQASWDASGPPADSELSLGPSSPGMRAGDVTFLHLGFPSCKMPGLQLFHEAIWGLK